MARRTKPKATARDKVDSRLISVFQVTGAGSGRLRPRRERMRQPRYELLWRARPKSTSCPRAGSTSLTSRRNSAPTSPSAPLMTRSGTRSRGTWINVLEVCGKRRPVFWMFVRDRQPTRAYVRLMERYRAAPELIGTQNVFVLSEIENHACNDHNDQLDRRGRAAEAARLGDQKWTPKRHQTDSRRDCGEGRDL